MSIINNEKAAWRPVRLPSPVRRVDRTGIVVIVGTVQWIHVETTLGFVRGGGWCVRVRRGNTKDQRFC